MSVAGLLAGPPPAAARPPVLPVIPRSGSEPSGTYDRGTGEGKREGKGEGNE